MIERVQPGLFALPEPLNGRLFLSSIWQKELCKYGLLPALPTLAARRRSNQTGNLTLNAREYVGCSHPQRISEDLKRSQGHTLRTLKILADALGVRAADVLTGI